MRSVMILAATALVTASVSFADGPELDPTFQLRLRWEGFGTPTGFTDRDAQYNFSNLRLRFGLESRWEHVTLAGELQGAAAADLPANGAFAIGPVYAAANSGETRPSQIGISQAYATFHSSTSRLQAGRQKWGDGFETLTGVGHLDGIKKRRMAERLVGNWDWVNVGRRYDGASGATSAGGVHLGGFAFRPLAGGVNYVGGFERLKGLGVYGATVTTKYGELLPSTELRLFAVRYDDERPGALAAAGDKLRLNTFGASLLGGGDNGDLMLWGVYQTGSWGEASQNAWAFIAEGGRKMHRGDSTFTLRGGVAQASGDSGDDEKHNTFFNLLPTNHKFYGSMDYNAFSNLRDLYGELLFQSGPSAVWSFRGAFHVFHLVDSNDAWYGGSGAFDLSRLGYAARRPASGAFASSDIGKELDISVGWKLHRIFKLDAGWSYFWGGAAAGEVLSVDQTGSWAFVQVVLTK